MSKIPKATEFFKQCFEGYHPSQYKELHDVQKTRAEFAMIAFAKLHVEAALKAANNTVVRDEYSLLNCYLLTNIK